MHQEDGAFLSAYLKILDPDWIAFLKEQANAEDLKEVDPSDPADTILDQLELKNATPMESVIDHVATQLFAGEGTSLDDAVHFAQIAAKLEVKAGPSFKFANRCGEWVSVSKAAGFGLTQLIADVDGTVEPLLPAKSRDEMLLHPKYQEHFASCTRAEWQEWVESGKAGVNTFVLPRDLPHLMLMGFLKFDEIKAKLNRGGYEGPVDVRYKNPSFGFEDWEFRSEIWKYWESESEKDADVWKHIGRKLLSMPPDVWKGKTSARAIEGAVNGSQKSITKGFVTPGWVLQLRSKPCIPDTHGMGRLPADLLLRTRETEPLLEVEAFVDYELDNEHTRSLLELLGVGAKPTGPDRILKCLRDLSRSDNPPLQEVEKWYRRLDQMIATCSTEDRDTIREAFKSEPLIRTEDGAWLPSRGVFQCANEEDVPGAAVIYAAVSDLQLWSRVGVAERPTADLAIKWLNQLVSGQQVAREERKRVTALLGRHPERVWLECGHWLNLEGEWVPTGSLKYALGRQSTVRRSAFFPHIKQETADFEMILATDAGFSGLPALGSLIEERPEGVRSMADPPATPTEWMQELGGLLQRVDLGKGKEEDNERIHKVARLLMNTQWVWVTELNVVPYLDKSPAGPRRSVDVAWIGNRLLVTEMPSGKLAKRIPAEIGAAFDESNIQRALDYSYGRSAEDVRVYVEDNFTLVDTASSRLGEEPTPPLDGPSQPQPIVAPDPGSAVGREPAVPPRPRPSPKTTEPPKPHTMELFARANGFERDGDGGFIHTDGSLLRRDDDDRDAWIRLDPTERVAMRYFPMRGTLNGAPLELSHEMWEMLKACGDTHTLILQENDETMREYTGTWLRAEQKAGRLKQYPASYRFVYRDE